MPCTALIGSACALGLCCRCPKLNKVCCVATPPRLFHPLLSLRPPPARHPDKNANSSESTEMFQKINAACAWADYPIISASACQDLSW